MPYCSVEKLVWLRADKVCFLKLSTQLEGKRVTMEQVRFTFLRAKQHKGLGIISPKSKIIAGDPVLLIMSGHDICLNRMDRRSWPWKKKSSEKTLNVTQSVAAPATTAVGNQNDQDTLKDAVKYVQVTEERYACLSGLEDQVKVLNEKLCTAQSEVTTKENLVKQHTRVAEEAVSGWEKAEAEASALKNQLESVTLLKLTVEERAAHLDGALKECMKQVRNVKEESEQKLHDVVFAKTMQWEKANSELEEKINALEQELLKSSAENDAFARSLQERSNMLMKISEEKSHADAEIEVLKTNMQSCEREISSLKYEVHIVSKELEIRNEEKNMSVRSAEVANKQHLEDVKKITKLEAECQRLRALVRKKLPGPAALAQMKLEVERDYGESRLRRSPAKNPSPHMGMGFPPDFLENIQQYQKQNEFLTARLLATEEETKMLKEALSKRNSELQASRSMFAKTASKLRSMEAHMLLLNHNKSPSKSIDILIETSPNHIDSKPPSMASMSEDGIDDEGTCTESWATALMSDLSHFKKDKDGDKSSKAGSSNHLELMDDFLEMEKLACLSTESNGPSTVFDGAEKTRTEISGGISPADRKDQDFDGDLPAHTSSSNMQQLPKEIASAKSAEQLSKLQVKIASLIESQVKDANVEKVLGDIKCIVQDVQEGLSRDSESFSAEDAQTVESLNDEKQCPHNGRVTADLEDLSPQHGIATAEMKPIVAENLKAAITQIHDFVISHGSNFDAPKVEEFSSVYNKVLSCEMDINSFILILSSVLSGAKDFGSSFFSDKNNDGESNHFDCIDKVTLLENKIVRHEHGKEGSIQSPDDPEVVQDGHRQEYELKENLSKCSTEEFEQLKQEKNTLATDLARCSECLEQTKSQLLQTEKDLAALQSELAASQKSNCLTETQLRCMAESYRSLESRSKKLESEVNQLRSRAETLENELQEERDAHQEDLTKLKDLQEQTERNGRCSMCSQSSETDAEVKTKQDKEIAAAAEKLAECQETILLLGRQLKALRPQPDFVGPSNERHMLANELPEDICGASALSVNCRQSGFQLENAEMEVAPPILQKAGGESPFNGYGTYTEQSETEASLMPMSPFNPNSAKHRSSKSSSNPTDDKHGRGSFARFFSKGKGNH